MSLLDEARKVQTGHNGPDCTVAALPPDLLTEVNEALDAKHPYKPSKNAVWATTLSNILHERGYELSRDVLNRHRRRGTAGGCQCPR